MPKEFAPADAVQIRATLGDFDLVDEPLGIFINEIDAGPNIISRPDYYLRLPTGALQIWGGQHARPRRAPPVGPAGFTRQAPHFQVISSLPVSVPPGGLFNSHPDDFFAPWNADELEQGDNDLGSGGPIVLSDLPGAALPRLLLGVGKDGVLGLLNRDSLGGAQSGADRTVASYALKTGDPWKLFGAPAYAEGPGGRFIYCVASGDVLRQFHLGDSAGGKGLFPSTPGRPSSFSRRFALDIE